MRPFELETSILLIVSAVVSGASLFLSRDRQIRLQLDDEYEPLPGASHHGGILPEKDPFDVVRPEDLVDGYPIDAERFWRRVRAQKLVLSAILSFLVAVEAVHLGYVLSASHPPDAQQLSSRSLGLVFDIYVLAIALFAVPQDSIHFHWPSIIHVSALTAISVLLRAISAILPSNVILKSTTPSNVTAAFNWIALVSLLSACVLAVNIPRGPALHIPASAVYSPKMLESTAPLAEDNVCRVVQSSVWDFLLFSYTTAVVNLGYTAESLEIRDLPIIPASFRATGLFSLMRAATISDTVWEEKMRNEQKMSGKRKTRWWWQRRGTGWPLISRLIRINAKSFAVEIGLAAVTAVLYYVPAWFLQRLVEYLQDYPHREDKTWGWIYCAGLFVSNSINYIATGQLWSISTTTLQMNLKVQLNTILFAKTLLRKDVASSSPLKAEREVSAFPTTLDTATAVVVDTSGNGAAPRAASADDDDRDLEVTGKDDEAEDFSAKQNVMTLMTTDVDRVSDFSWHVFSLVDAPIEIIIGSIYLYHLLGSSCLFGLAATCMFIPLNHFASKYVVLAQDSLMKARDERVSLMNEILGGIRMLKFMAWERNFEKRVFKVREKELKYQKQNYIIEVIFIAVWAASPVIVTVVSFFHFTVIRGQYLSPAIAFTSLSVFNELKFALNALPETFINMLQSLVSVRRIEKYLASAEVSTVQPLDEDYIHSMKIVLSNATIGWPQDNLGLESRSLGPSATATPSLRGKFVLHDVSLNIPIGELTLICGKLGSGKTLLLLALLGEADLLAGQIICPRTPPDALATFATAKYIDHEDWVLPGICAYVPQTAWLQNASIKDNILFNLPFDDRRYRKTLEVCALIPDLKIIEDGDDAEIGERGVNLSGGQKARVSLARAVYSRASILFLDDVLSAVDAHTARHIYDQCLKGPLMERRTVVLVSHHVQLCVSGANYVVALDNGRVEYSGSRDGFFASGVSAGVTVFEDDGKAVHLKEPSMERSALPLSEAASTGDSQAEEIDESPESTIANVSELDTKTVQIKAPRKLIEEERRAIGRISRDVWLTYFKACGGWGYWGLLGISLLLGTISPVVENGWLSHWSDADDAEDRPLKYVGIYAMVTVAGILVQTLRWFFLYQGSITASTSLHKKLLESVLFAKIRFHDTVSRGRLLNRFGKDFETIDSGLADNLGRTIIYSLSVLTTFLTVTWLGGPLFFFAALLLGVLYYNAAKVYGQTSRDMRRLDSVTRSPLYSMYGESISGVAVVRAYGASTKFIRDMHKHVDTNSTPFYWSWSVNRWLSVRFNLLSSAVVGATAVTVLVNRNVNAAAAGFALSFAGTVTNDLLFMVRRFVGLEQSMVALERINEFSTLPQEAPEFIEPRPPAGWPHNGNIDVDNLVIRYAPDLPDVLHNLNFSVEAGTKIGVLGRTGGGKSTLALSFFRFVEATEGRIVIDGINIADVGLTDLRSRLTIIPQDPTILSGTLRTTLDVFEEYEDVEIFEALRRVHLIPSEDDATSEIEVLDGTNSNVFKNLDSPVSEGGENFSAGEKQLICMARAILKKTKVLFMDEATASVDYATDELISHTIRKEFAESTILTIAHRLRTVIDYDKVLVLDQGRIAEFDEPHVLLCDEQSVFHALCKATGKEEFSELKRMAKAASVLKGKLHEI